MAKLPRVPRSPTTKPTPDTKSDTGAKPNGADKKPTEQSSAQGQPAPTKTAANTSSHPYLDTFNKEKVCEKDRKAIAKACKPEPTDKDGNSKKKTKGITSKISKMTEKLDAIGKGISRYTRKPGNEWMDDHCSGLWLKPYGYGIGPTKGYDSTQLEVLKETIENLDVDILDKFDLLQGSLREMFELAYEMLPADVVEDIFVKFAAKAGIKMGAGILAGPETAGAVTALMAAWTIYDIIDTAETLAGLMGDKGKQALEAILNIDKLGDKVKEFLDDLVTQPAKAHTNMMSLLALMDSCLRARKCMLVPYSKQNSNSGDGCCPGQTGHHVIPHSAALGSCDPYTEGSAPVMCLEGTSHYAGWGTHGNAHQELKERLRRYRTSRSDSGLSPNTISYDDMANNAVDAVRLSGAALQCDKDCLLAQLRAYYKCPNGMPPKDGTGQMPKMPEPTPKPDINIPEI